MPVDVERQLAALGRFWNDTVAHVHMSEIGFHEARTPEVPPDLNQFTEEEAIMIELETRSQTPESRRGPKWVVFAGLLAAAAVAAIVIVSTRNDDTTGTADEPSTAVTVPATTVTVPPTTPPRALFRVPGGQLALASGTYFIDEVQGVATPQILVTIGSGWATFEDWAISKVEVEGLGQGMTFTRPENVYLDACHPSDGLHTGPLTTLDGLVTALSEQRGWVDVTAPADISIDGYAGKTFRRSAPTDLSECTGDLRKLTSDDKSVYSEGETVVVLVLDLDGTVAVVETRVDQGQPAQAHAEVATMVDSLRIAQG